MHSTLPGELEEFRESCRMAAERHFRLFVERVDGGDVIHLPIMGLRGTELHELRFDDHRVPPDALLARGPRTFDVLRKVMSIRQGRDLRHVRALTWVTGDKQAGR